MDDTVETEDLILRREGAAGRITLNRPKALNAITFDMVRGLQAKLNAWATDDQVNLLIIDGAGERGFCAGGDVRALYESRQAQDGMAEMFWREEYELNAAIARYPKPYVAIMNGIVMGGGVGVSAHGSHRIVTESTKIAMPEAGIGLMPDVGGSWILSHAPGETGTYLGLTGTRIGARDAVYTGFADIAISEAHVSTIIEALCHTDYESDPFQKVDNILAGFPKLQTEPELPGKREVIDKVFRFDDVEKCLEAINDLQDDWGKKLAETILSKSPLSLKITLEALRRGRKMADLEACLNMEYRLILRLFQAYDFFEGVRAIIIEKDNKPVWNPATLEDISQEMIAEYFASLGETELGLTEGACG